MVDSKQFTKELDAIGKVLDALSGLSKKQRQFVIRAAADRYNLQVGTKSEPSETDGGSEQESTPLSSDVKKRTPKAFLKAKNPTTDVERIACLSYYLTHGREVSKFKTNDLTKLNTDAAQPSFSNAANTVKNATNQNRFLAPAGKGYKQITALGEEYVEALPDQDKVKQVVKKYRKRRRKKTARKKRKRKN
jgi:hypothetical protein